MFTHVAIPTLPVVTDEMTAQGKRFYLTPEGNKYPSVTTMLGHKEKPWLEDWRNSLGTKKAAKETKRCSDRGTAIHELAEKYLNNDPFPEATKGYKQEYINGFNKFKLELNNVNNIRTQEAALYSDTLGIAGRVDCIGEYKGTLCVVDFKTSTNNKDNDMIFDYYLQTTAYASMWHEMTGEPIEDITIIMSVEKGIMPCVFKDKIDTYVEPLLERISEYRKAA